MWPLLTRHAWLPLHEWLLRRRTFRYWRELEQSQWWSRDQLGELQLAKLREQNHVMNQKLADLKKIYIKGLLEMTNNSIAPDANSTIRFTSGPIKGYVPKDAVYYNPISTLKGLIEKDSGEYPFHVPEKLKTLYLESTRVSNITSLENLTNLQYLGLNRTQVSDIQPLSNLTELREISFVSSQIRDLSPLAYCKNLQKLSFFETKVTDITPLAGLTELKYLELGNTQVRDIESLSKLTKMEYLGLRGTQVSDIKSLEGLKNLKRLDLDGTQVSDIAPLSGLKNLQSLYISNKYVSYQQIAQLNKALPKLSITR